MQSQRFLRSSVGKKQLVDKGDIAGFNPSVFYLSLRRSVTALKLSRPMSIAQEEVRAAGEGARVHGVPFRLALPLGQLVLCALILWPIRGLILAELGLPMAVRLIGPPLFFRSGPGRMFLEWSLRNGRQTVAAINLPAGLAQLPTVLLRADKTEWRPAAVDFLTWRAVTWPLLGMVFWWIAGRGVDALVAAPQKAPAPRIGWTETVLGFVLGAGGLVGAIAFLLTAGPDLHDRQLQLFMSSAGMWGLLGSLTVAARVVQWRMGKAARAISADCLIVASNCLATVHPSFKKIASDNRAL